MGIMWVTLLQPGNAGKDALPPTEVTLPPISNQTTVESTVYNIFSILEDLTPENIVKEAANFNILAIITASIVFALALIAIGKKARPIIGIFRGLSAVVYVIVNWILWFVPLGIMSLITSKLASTDNFLVLLSQLGMFVATVVVGLAVHFLFVLPGLYLIFVRKNPFKYLFAMTPALLTALGIASSSATLPVTEECVKTQGIPKRIYSFVLPLGAT